MRRRKRGEFLRIYLDNNIYSCLKQDKEPTGPLSAILRRHGQHTYFYSEAHICDLKTDSTTHKYDDLEFMRRIVGTNYLCKYYNRDTNCFIATPREAFETMETDDVELDFESIIRDPSFAKKANETETFFAQATIPELNLNQTKLPDSIRTYIENIISQTANFDILRLARNGMDFYAEMEQGSSYRELRKYLKDNQAFLFQKKIEKLGDTNVDDLFENSIIKNRFMDFVDSNISFDTGNANDKMYYQFLMAYVILNSLGLDGEKNRKVMFTNTSIDSRHAYYAGFCDVLVTNDKGLREKAKILYSLFRIDTKILDLTSFQEYLEEIDKKEKDALGSLQANIVEDLGTREVLLSEETGNQLTIRIEAAVPYFSTFSHIQIQVDVTKSSCRNVLFHNSPRRISVLVVFSEVRTTCDYCSRVLGNDLEGIGPFGDTDIEEIREKEWKGRTWLMQNGSIHLNICRETNLLYLNTDLRTREQQNEDTDQSDQQSEGMGD